MRRLILRVGQTDVYLHPATLLFTVYALYMGFWPVLLTGFLSILLHECAHAAASALLGQPPAEMELTPLGAVMRLEDEERLPPVRRLIVLAAGPLMTLALCGMALLLAKLQVMPVSMARRFFYGNVAILMMNLLPALPLDGGRMLALLLNCFFRGEAVRRVMRTAGTLLGLACIGLSVWLAWRHGAWNLSLAAAGCFLLYSAEQATTAQALAELRMLMDRKILLERRGSLKCRRMAILSGASLRQAVRLLVPGAVTDFELVEPGTMRRAGTLTETDVISAYLTHPEMSCRDVLFVRDGKKYDKN